MTTPISTTNPVDPSIPNLHPLSRRAMLQVAGLGALAAGLPLMLPDRAIAQPSSQPMSPPPLRARSRVLRVAHLSDIHVQPEKQAREGLAACLRHVQALTDVPQLILTGGDLIFDSFDTPFERSSMLWDILLKTFKDESSIPVEHTLGNHDIFGWNKQKAGTTGDEPLFGKKLALDRLGLAKPYRSFDRAGWHFIVLDSVQPDGGGYLARLDPEQLAWLDADLAANPGKPTLVVSHIPIISTTIFSEPKGGENAHRVPFAVMHADAMPLHERFAKHGGVRVCLSGHIHRHDRVAMPGIGQPSNAIPITYICGGAVSGSWWDGRKQRCDEGYGVVDLFDDGTFEHQYVAYRWVAKP